MPISRPMVRTSYGCRMTMMPSLPISDIEPCCSNPANSLWKYSRLMAISATPANEPSGFDMRRSPHHSSCTAKPDVTSHTKPARPIYMCSTKLTETGNGPGLSNVKRRQPAALAPPPGLLNDVRKLRFRKNMWDAPDLHRPSRSPPISNICDLVPDDRVRPSAGPRVGKAGRDLRDSTARPAIRSV